ncbi:MAG: recombinase, partial [Bacteroidales bacterium]|nr:recombinase [Bacteroidales bacterium]
MNRKQTIVLSNDFHNGKDIVTLKFDYDQELISVLKTNTGARWSRGHRFWYLPKEEFNLRKVFNVLKPIAFLD